MYPHGPALPPQKRKLRPVVLALVSLGLAVIIFLGFLTFRTLVGVLRTPGETATATYENDRIRFDVPTEFKRKGSDNIDYVDLGDPASVREVWNVFLEGSQAGATVSYKLSATGEKIEAPYDDRVADIKVGLEMIAGFSPERIIDQHATIAHGCAGNFKFLQSPFLVDRDGIVGFQYTYECMSFYGPVKGITTTFYDEYGSVHRLTVDALSSYWDENQRALTSVIDSVRSIL